MPVSRPLDRIGARKRAEGPPADRLPPGQHIPRGWPALHYGRVPVFDERTWDFRVFGATADGAERCWGWTGMGRLPRTDVVADFHCVTKFSLLDNAWTGIATSVLVEQAPPAPGVTHVMAWGEYGYSANLRLEDFTAPDALLATHRSGEPLTPEHGFPLRLVVPHLYAWKGPKWLRAVEYLTEDRRGFWEERGYHNCADPWQEQRYSYQEEPGAAPEL